MPRIPNTEEYQIQKNTKYRRIPTTTVRSTKSHTLVKPQFLVKEVSKMCLFIQLKLYLIWCNNWIRKDKEKHSDSVGKVKSKNRRRVMISEPNRNEIIFSIRFQPEKENKSQRSK
jgi:hypothetical protein